MIVYESGLDVDVSVVLFVFWQFVFDVCYEFGCCLVVVEKVLYYGQIVIWVEDLRRVGVIELCVNLYGVFLGIDCFFEFIYVNQMFI